MYRKSLISVGLFSILMICSVSPLQAGTIDLDYDSGSGIIESGWYVNFGGSTTGISVTDVDLTNKTATITITKDYDQAPTLNPFSNQWDFQVGWLTFIEDSANSGLIDKIIIDSESIANNTGVTWGGFRWLVEPAGAAEFNASESSGWNEPSFTTWTFSNSDNQLDATNGSGVASSSVFAPGANGDLVIDVDLDSSDAALSVHLKQHVTPEPATMAILVAGSCTILRRRFRKR
ncbi:MAG: hypothetical protein GY794_05110 [bacterium]|nr:hypothetical protein [bacterium]